MKLNYLKKYLSVETRGMLGYFLIFGMLFLFSHFLSISLIGIAPPVIAICITCLALFITDANLLQSSFVKISFQNFKKKIFTVNLFVSLGAYLLIYLIPNPVVFTLYLVACVACKIQLQPSISNTVGLAATSLTIVSLFFITPTFISYLLSACICTLPSFILTCVLYITQEMHLSLGQDDTLTGPNRKPTTLWLQNISELHTIIQPQPSDLKSLFAFIQTYAQELHVTADFAIDLCTYIKTNYSNTSVGDTKWSANQALLVTWIASQAADMHDASYDKTIVIDFLKHAENRSDIRKKHLDLYPKGIAGTNSKAMIQELVTISGIHNKTREECVYGRICILQKLFSENIQTFLESSLDIKLDNSYQFFDCIPNRHIIALTRKATKQLCKAATPFLQNTSPMNTYASQVVKPLCDKQGLSWKASEEKELQKIISTCNTPQLSIQRICLWHSQRLIDHHDYSTKKPKESHALLECISDLAEARLRDAR